MDNLELLICGSLWQNLGDDDAGWELIRCLRSSDPQVRGTAQGFLLEAGPRSIKLLQAAVAAGVLDGTVAAECIVTLIDCISHDNGPDSPVCAAIPYDC